MLLLHDGRGDDAVRGFFGEAQELHLRAALNPFYSPAARLASREFDRRIRAAARRFFG